MSRSIRIKMCGMTREADIQHAVRLGVDAIGLIFYPQSKRYLSLQQAKDILVHHPLFVDIVAVFVNPDVEMVRSVISELPIQWLQFHGEESAAFCRQFHLPYIKAIPALNEVQIRQAMNVYSDAAAIMLDTPSPDHGGTGKVFDWNMIPQKRNIPLILAGGLNAENVLSAVDMCHPTAVDVCTGVEIAPGIKDHQQMSSFVTALED